MILHDNRKNPFPKKLIKADEGIDKLSVCVSCVINFLQERETGVGPATSTLARSRSTTELFPQEYYLYSTEKKPKCHALNASKTKKGRKKEPGGDLLSRLLRGSIIGVGGLNFRVRKGNGCNTSTITTRQLTTGLGVAARYNPETGRVFRGRLGASQTLTGRHLQTGTIIWSSRTVD